MRYRPAFSRELEEAPARHAPSALTLPIALLVALAAVIIAWGLVPAGFTGYDDAQYLRGVLRWLEQGPRAGRTHWEARSPYLALLAGSAALFGPTPFALALPHSLAFVAAVLLLAWLGQRWFGPAVGLWAAMLACFSPIGLRLPTQVAPEVVELALSLGGFVCLMAWQDRRQRCWLLLAGLLGGTALVIRETALLVPLAMAAWLLADRRTAWRHRCLAVAALAVAFLPPILADAIFNWASSGDLLHRVWVDMAHTRIASTHLEGGTFDGSPFFNWTLAARWSVSKLLALHWSVDPLVRLATAPASALLVWAGILAAPLAWRAWPDSRPYLWLALGCLLGQWVLNTFILVIAPNIRYVFLPLLMLTPLIAAGLFAATASVPSRRAMLAVWAAAGLLMLGAEADPGRTTREAASWGQTGETFHLIGYELDRLALASALGQVRISTEPTPIGGLTIWDPFSRSDIDLAATCESGDLMWQREREAHSARPLGTLLDAAGLSRWVFGPVRHYLASADVAVLLRRQC